MKEIPICENVVRLKRCSCAEVAGENPDCELHGVSVQAWAQMSDDDCMMEPDIDSFTVRRKSQEAAAIIRDLAAVVEKCRDKFDHYEQLHRLKCTAEGDEKADRNREMADACRAALSRAQVQG